MQFMKRCTKLVWQSQNIIKFSLLSTLLLISACAWQTGGQDSVTSKAGAQERKAGQLFDQGNYRGAADSYQRLAQNPSARQNILRLKAAQAWLKIPEDDKAKKYLDLIAPASLNTAQLNRLYLMYAQLELNSGNVEQAQNYSKRISVFALSRAQKVEYYAMTAFSYALTGQTLKSIQERIALASYLDTKQQQEQNNKAILELLSLISEQTLLEQLQQQNAIIYNGWLALEQTRRDYPGGEQQQAAFNAWSEEYPRHPAQGLVSSGYFLVFGFKLANLQTIAVFLPESGPFSAYAAAIKAGFTAAYNQQQGYRPNVRFYDTQQADISIIYRRAVADGAQLIIGPLNKKYIQELAERNDLIVPVMALNYVESLAKSNLYQFALSPIDEVQQAVRQARFTGHENAIILAPGTTEGERMSQYFQHAWEELDGNVLAVQSFDSRAKDFSFPVKQMLSINESQYRYNQLKQVIGTVEYQPRRRQDVDVIFLAASAKNARLINPQFYHNRAGSVAVYGLSRVYRGYADKPQDMDLEGVSFCTIPWLFDAAYQGELSMLSLQEIKAQYPQKYSSLIAFGIDAYAIVAHLNDIAITPYYGATGDLLLNDYNRIERHLVCAKFNDGEALLVEMAKEDEVPVDDITSTKAL